jgi:hypothetical protein
MLVVGNDIGGISRKSTIHKLVVVMIGLYQPKLEIGSDPFDIFAFQQ